LKAIPLSRSQIQSLIESPGIKFVCPSFVLLCRLSPEQRLSILVGKKLGKAVNRNRIRRRLRESFRQTDGFPSGEYALMGRSPSLTVPFETLLEQMGDACRTLNRMKA